MQSESTTALAPRTESAIDASTVLNLALSSRKPATIRLYRKAYADFARWLHPAGGTDITALRTLLALSHGEANAAALKYRGDLMERGLKANTVNTYLAALRSFVGIANTCGVVPWELEVKNIPIRAYRDTAGPGHDAYKRMLEKAAERGENDPMGLRDIAMMKLFHDVGLRRFEVVALNVADIDPDREWGRGSRGAVQILGKGRSDPEWQGLPGKTLKAVLRWLDVRGREPGPLFVTMDPAESSRIQSRPDYLSRLSAMAMWRIVRRYAKLAGIERPMSPHRLRHAGGTRAAQKTNGNAMAVQEWGRWKSLATAQIYVKNDQNLGAMTAEQVAED